MLYINGEWRQANSGETLDVINPATGDVLEQVASAGKEETKEAIEVANEAFSLWKNKTGAERGKYLMDIAQKMKSKTDSLAKTITLEMGKPLAEAKREVMSSIAYIEWYAEEAKRMYGETIPPSDPNKHLMLLREPIGVAAAITPWNFPMSMIARKIAPAIAAGCTIIIKPAPDTPLSAIRMFECFHEAGLPKGVANLLIGSAEEIGPELTGSSKVRKLTFTGSTAVGKMLIRDTANTVKNLSMELGGHAPFIVFEDADLDAAAEGAMATNFINNGQTCICTNRIYVKESIAEEFGKKLAEKTATLKIGNGMDEGTQVGPLINENSFNKVQSHVEDALKHNGKILCGGKPYERDDLKGYFFEPTVIASANDDMLIATEETFGPVAPIFTFKNEEEAIHKANDTPYGLAAYCFTKDLGRGLRMMNALEYGIVGINDAAPVTVQGPFGGYKESGIGREGGKSGILQYVEEKYVSIGMK